MELSNPARHLNHPNVKIATHQKSAKFNSNTSLSSSSTENSHASSRCLSSGRPSLRCYYHSYYSISSCIGAGGCGPFVSGPWRIRGAFLPFGGCFPGRHLLSRETHCGAPPYWSPLYTPYAPGFEQTFIFLLIVNLNHVPKVFSRKEEIHYPGGGFFI